MSDGEVLGKSIIKMYSVGACAVLRMTNQEELSEDQESDPFPELCSPEARGDSLTFMTGVLMSGYFLRPPKC